MSDLVKKAIKTVRFTAVIEATKVNENGTLSGLTVISIKAGSKALDDGNLYMTLPNFGHSGQMLARVNTLEGLTVIDTPEKADKGKGADKPKLFTK